LSGEVGAWESDGTLWRSHEPPSPEVISGTPSPSLLPPDRPHDSFVQTQIRRQQEAALERQQMEALQRQFQLERQVQLERQQELDMKMELERQIEEEKQLILERQVKLKKEAAIKTAEEEEAENEAKAIEPLMALVEAIFSLPPAPTRTHTKVAKEKRRPKQLGISLPSVSPRHNKKSGSLRQGRRGGRGKNKGREQSAGSLEGEGIEAKGEGRGGRQGGQQKRKEGHPRGLGAHSLHSMMRNKVRTGCEGRGDGLHPDLHSGCQEFFMCHAGRRSGQFSCPGGTLFSDAHRVCDWRGKVSCTTP